MTAGRAVVLFVALAAMPAPAGAQSRPAPPEPGVGLRGYAAFGIVQLAATDTFKAIAGTSQRPVFGGGVQVTNIWRGLFADGGASRISRIDGERVFVHNRQVFALDIPLEVKMRAVDLAAGWRLTYGRLSPYAAAGVTFLSYEETSVGADNDENVSESRRGPLFLGGVDVAIVRWLHAGGEIRYRAVKGILGEGGASEAFGEENAGGLAAAIRVSVGR